MSKQSPMPPQQPKKKPTPKRSLSSYIVSTLLIFTVITVLYSLVSGEARPKEGTVTLSEVARLVEGQQIKSIVVDGEKLTVTKADDTVLTSKKEPTASLVETLAAYGVAQPNLAAVDISVAS